MNRPRFLNKIEDANVNKAMTLRQRIESDVDHSQVDKKQPFSLQTFAVFQSRLINFNDYPVDFRNNFEESFLDVDLLRKLERSKVINWYRTAKLLYPLKTTGDSNCLFHAVSLAMWAIEDTQQFLRRLVYLTLSTDPTGIFKRRWLFNRRPIQDAEANLRQNTCDILVEWESIVKAAADIQQQQEDMLPFAILESFHLYVLANVLRRPIIVLADKKARNISGQSLQESNIGGIYLPLETVPAECVKTPVIIGYNMNHFAPLVTQDGDSSSRMDVVPLVTHELEMMMVHYLLPGEEPDVVRLLENYLQMTETLLTETDYIKPILLVHLEERKLPEDLNLMEDLRQDCENKFREWIDQEFGSENSVVLTQENLVVTPKQNIVVSQRMPELQDNSRGPSLAMIMTPVPLRQTPLHPQVMQLVSNHSNREKCLTTGCMMYGSPEMYNLCSKCFRDYSNTYHNQEQTLRCLRDAVSVTPLAPITTISQPDICIGLSIVPEKCKTECCDCLCSQTTFPYCHVCYEKQQDHNEIAHVSLQESALRLHNVQQAIATKPHMGVDTHHVGLNTQPLNVAQTVPEQIGLSKGTYKTASSHEAMHLSIKDEICPTEGCRNHVSKNTEPVCHECYHKLQRTPKLSQPAQTVHGQNFNTNFTSLASVLEPTFESLRLESSQSCMYEPAQFVLPSSESVETSPRLVTLATGLVSPTIVSDSRRCKAEGCFNYAVPGNNGLCETCYNNCLFGEGDIRSNENVKQFTNAETLKELSGTANTCFSTGYENVPLGGRAIYHQCYRSSASGGTDINGDEVMNTTEEKSTGAKMQGFSPAHENIPGQFVVSDMTPPSRSLTSQPTGHNNATMTDLRSKSSNDSYVERKYICATPGCQGIRLKNTLDLCYKCLIRATPKKESRNDLDTEENAEHVLNHSAVLCSTEIFMEYEEEKRLDSTLTETMVSCAGITCGNLIYPPKKLCDECQEILECAYTSKSKQDFRLGRQNVTAPILSNPVPLQPRPHTAPVDAKTNIRTCDCYSGGPDTGNMCTAHFPYTQITITTTCQPNAPLAERQHVPSDDQQDIHPVNQNMSNPNPQDTYSTNVSANVQTFPLKSVSKEDSKTGMTDIDQSCRSNSKCIIQECLNFGNPLNQGICNTCAMTHFDLSRRSNSKCIIQECLNIGNPLNQGICNTCAMTHFDLSRRSNSKCCIQECLNIGNPLNQGICNTCAMTHFDLSRRSNSKCIIQECLNIGNPLNQGICNTCAMTHFDLSRRSNSKCIIQECLNIGNPLNQGICNTCAMTHFDFSRRSNSKCIIQECLNIGNPLNQGICNTCAMTHFDLSRRSNSKCIIQECMNFGSIQNEGMCNDCLRAYLAEK